MTKRQCIYCQQPFDSDKGQGDHIIPVQFGEFRNAKRFRGCCVRCNNDIGKSEEQLMRCGSEAVILHEFKPAVPRKRNRGLRSAVGAHGALPPRHSVLREDHEEPVLAEQGSPGTIRPIDHLHLKLRTGERTSIELFPKMTEPALRRRLLRNTDAGIETIWLSCEKQDYQRYLHLVKAICPTCKVTDLPDTPMGATTVTVKTQLQVTERFFRAIAKVGFHYYLSYSSRGLNGSESAFTGIRDFIMNGGDPTDYVRDQRITFGENIVAWLQQNVEPQGRCHILGLEDSIDKITVFAKMFHGDVRSICYRIALGAVTGGWTFSARLAHAFVYDVPQPKNGFAGVVHELPAGAQ